MTGAELLETARKAGLTVSLTTAGTIKINGSRAAIAALTPTLREHRATVIEAMSTSSWFPVAAYRAVSRWLDRIGEDDPATRALVMRQCLDDGLSRQWYLRRAAGDTFHDVRKILETVK